LQPPKREIFSCLQGSASFVEEEAKRTILNFEFFDAGEETLDGGVVTEIGGDEIKAFDVSQPSIWNGYTANADVGYLDF
jgi:hypothetical protein